MGRTLIVLGYNGDVFLEISLVIGYLWLLTLTGTCFAPPEDEEIQKNYID